MTADEILARIRERVALSAAEKARLIVIEALLEFVPDEEPDAALDVLIERLERLALREDWKPTDAADLDRRVDEVFQELEDFFRREKAFAGLAPGDALILAKMGVLEAVVDSRPVNDDCSADSP